MRLLFGLFSIALIMAWYAYAIRPGNRKLSNTLLGISGALLVLLIAGFLRLA